MKKLRKCDILCTVWMKSWSHMTSSSIANLRSVQNVNDYNFLVPSPILIIPFLICWSNYFPFTDIGKYVGWTFPLIPFPPTLAFLSICHHIFLASKKVKWSVVNILFWITIWMNYFYLMEGYFLHLFCLIVGGIVWDGFTVGK